MCVLKIVCVWRCHSNTSSMLRMMNNTPDTYCTGMQPTQHLSLVLRITERPVAALEGDERVDEALGDDIRAVMDLLKTRILSWLLLRQSRSSRGMTGGLAWTGPQGVWSVLRGSLSDEDEVGLRESSRCSVREP